MDGSKVKRRYHLSGSAYNSGDFRFWRGGRGGRREGRGREGGGGGWEQNIYLHANMQKPNISKIF